MGGKIITVTAAIIEKNRKILAARRQPGDHLAGYWEFPGGKVEPGESETQCLLRELYEEFRVVCSIDRFLTESIYDYGSKIIKLRGYLVYHLSGTFECSVHDALIWLSPDELHTIRWAPADLPLVEETSRTFVEDK